MRNLPARIGADIGGTFTDLILERGGQIHSAKRLTIHAAPERALLDGLSDLLAAANVSPAEVELIVHGTTLATNALIERRGAHTAMLTTQGFRDTIELGTESRFDQYDIGMNKPPPLIRRRWRLPIPERIAADGTVLLPLDAAAVRAAIREIGDGGIESVAVAYLHSYSNPLHERQTAALLAEALPQVSVSLSSEVSPEIREYERFSTTVANAYVQPLMAGYLERLQQSLRARGFACPLFLMLSSGGITTVEQGRRFPVRLVESGPAGGAIFAATLARARGLDRVLSFDMGGTTAKLCLIDDFVPRAARSFEVARMHRWRKGSGIPLRIPVVEMVEIGAGGGSIARRDAMGRILVGPDSAGSEPGPACYGRGGVAPTVTDADLLLGRIQRGRFAGGHIALDVELAGRAVESIVAEPGNTQATAFGIAEIVDETMTSAARVHAVEQGASLAGRAMIAFGGAAPLHAARLAEKMGIEQVVIPPHAGVGSAVGFLRAPTGFELTHSLHQLLAGLDVAAVNAMLDAMAREAHQIVMSGAPDQPRHEARQAFARYAGQGHEIPIPLPARRLESGDVAALQAAFDTAYVAQYGRTIPGMVVEVLTWSVTVATSAACIPRLPDAPESQRALTDHRQRVFDTTASAWIDVELFERAQLVPGARVDGPALIVEDATTTVVPGSFVANVDAAGAIVLRRRTTGSPSG
jgi:N-methylhydantoinase A